MRELKVGDTVVCINTGGSYRYELNKIYKVSRAREASDDRDGQLINVVGLGPGMFSFRFKRVANKKFDKEDWL